MRRAASSGKRCPFNTLACHVISVHPGHRMRATCVSWRLGRLLCLPCMSICIHSRLTWHLVTKRPEVAQQSMG